MARYIGITLGPIGDTMNLTSTPAGLWAASYLFSFLAHEIRANIGKEGIIQDSLQYENGKVSTLFEKGVGLYHDRIIYQADDKYTLESASEAIGRAVDGIVQGFLKSDTYKDKESLALYLYV